MKQLKIKKEATPGFEPGTVRAAIECSTTEVCPLREYKDEIIFFIKYSQQGSNL